MLLEIFRLIFGVGVGIFGAGFCGCIVTVFQNKLFRYTAIAGFTITVMGMILIETYALQASKDYSKGYLDVPTSEVELAVDTRTSKAVLLFFNKELYLSRK